MQETAKEQLKQHVERALPHTHLICSRGIDQVLKTAWSIVSNAKNEYQKIHALNLIHQCYITKQNLMTDATVINAALEMIKKSKKELEDIKQDGNASFTDEAIESLTGNLQALTLERSKRKFLPPTTITPEADAIEAEIVGDSNSDAIVVGANSTSIEHNEAKTSMSETSISYPTEDTPTEDTTTEKETEETAAPTPTPIPPQPEAAPPPPPTPHETAVETETPAAPDTDTTTTTTETNVNGENGNAE